ncbi:Acetyltransferase (GNAT) family/Acetyltransferase (GNAT) domain containing protein, putative [Angomonas deanei]|uniref:Acetyltransferase (GNAT) family/Acetyltransferase (GNAT) domain containing protein, putative n=1 Tax=Angomonas deanei TaxID=59799 RepID=A0A7G2CBV7_9TRYP|nr:Acetyltransferase (GNAT) family/Acetyltransferase (GNAT) domain containing protein, putative [Angomonas deanei]
MPQVGINAASITAPFASVAGKKLNFLYKPTLRADISAKAKSHIDGHLKAKGLTLPPFNPVDWAFTARSPDNKITAICMGYCAWTECQVNTLAVTQAFQPPKGTGTVILRAVEEFARKNNQSRLALHTYSWQAKPFYEKLGFRDFGTQTGVPPGHARHNLEKVFSWEGSALPPLPSGEAAQLKLVEEPVEAHPALDQQCQNWLNDDTQRRNTNKNIPDYVKQLYGLEVVDPQTNKPIGAVVYETLWSEAHVSYYTVAPEMQRKGVGSKMLEDFKLIASEKGCGRIALETISPEKKALFEKFGFKVFGVQEDIPVKGMTRYFMENVF